MLPIWYPLAAKTFFDWMWLLLGKDWACAGDLSIEPNAETSIGDWLRAVELDFDFGVVEEERNCSLKK